MEMVEYMKIKALNPKTERFIDQVLLYNREPTLSHFIPSLPLTACFQGV